MIPKYNSNEIERLSTQDKKTLFKNQSTRGALVGIIILGKQARDPIIEFMKQFHILYSGHVQGVGFRYTIYRLAKQFDMTGWVRNLPSGSVELMVEGSSEEIGGLCQDIETTFKGHIRDKQVSEKEIENPEYNTFKVTF